METLFVQFTNAAWDWIIQERKKKRNKNCIKSELSQFLFLQQKIQYVSLLAIFIILLIKLLLFVNANVSQDV